MKEAKRGWWTPYLFTRKTQICTSLMLILWP